MVIIHELNDSIYYELCGILFYERNQARNGQAVLIILNMVPLFQDIHCNSSIFSPILESLIIQLEKYNNMMSQNRML